MIEEILKRYARCDIIPFILCDIVVKPSHLLDHTNSKCELRDRLQCVILLCSVHCVVVLIYCSVILNKVSCYTVLVESCCDALQYNHNKNVKIIHQYSAPFIFNQYLPISSQLWWSILSVMTNSLFTHIRVEVQAWTHHQPPRPSLMSKSIFHGLANIIGWRFHCRNLNTKWTFTEQMARGRWIIIYLAMRYLTL